MRPKGGAMSPRSPKGYGDLGPRPNGLTEMDRANLRALCRVLYRRHGTWIAVAHRLAFRRETIVRFVGMTFSGNMALARTIARACGLTVEEALDGRFTITAKDEILPKRPAATGKRGAK